MDLLRVEEQGRAGRHKQPVANKEKREARRFIRLRTWKTILLGA
jgi:hypothetical protein